MKLMAAFGFWRTTWRAFVWVWGGARRHFAITLGAELLSAVSLAVVLLCARSLAEALTTGNQLESVGDVGLEVACLSVALFASGISMVVQREARLIVTEGVLCHLETEIIDICGTVPYERFEESDFQDMLRRSVGHGANRAMQLAYDLIGLANALITSGALFFVLASSAPSVVPWLIVVAIPLVAASRLSATLSVRLTNELTPDDRLRSTLFSTLIQRAAAKEVRVFELQAPLSSRWRVLYEARIARLARLAWKRSVMNSAASLAAAAAVAALLFVIVDAAVDERISLADGAIAIVAIQQLAARIRAMANATGSLRESALFLDDFERFRELRTTVEAAPAADDVMPPLVELQVKNVRFTYPGTDSVVLDGVDIELRAGEVVALVGLSGSGKTTLAHLVAGLYGPTSGTITWNGIDTTTIPRRTYWQSMGAVFQDFYEYSLTAGENVSIGNHHRADDQPAILDAMQRADITSAIERLPNGHETMLDRGFVDGADLSHGEWQRLAVARAFFRDAPVLILDEPASALDPIAERRLYERLADLTEQRSVLLISHRFSTVRLADRIYVLEGGRIIEHGSHAQLLDADGHYATMFRAQAAGFVDEVHN